MWVRRGNCSLLSPHVPDAHSPEGVHGKSLMQGSQINQHFVVKPTSFLSAVQIHEQHGMVLQHLQGTAIGVLMAGHE